MIVAFTVSCLRQQHLRASIESWARARGSGHARFLFCLEPPGSFPVTEFQDYLERVFPGRVMVYVNDVHFGCLRNTRLAMDMAMALSDDDFGVVAEEDIEVADDILEYLAWARDAYREDGQVAAVCAHARSSKVPDSSAVVRAAWFCPLIWGTWRDQWRDFIEPAWGPLEGTNNPESWDNNLQQLLQRTRRTAVFPARSRSIHKGVMSTQLGTLLSEHIYPASVSDCFSRTYPAQEYREVEYPEGGLLWV